MRSFKSFFIATIIFFSLPCVKEVGVVFAQNENTRSGVIGGTSLSWHKDIVMPDKQYSFPDKTVSFHVGYQFQFDLKHKLSIDAALLYGQKRGRLSSYYAIQAPNGYENKFSRNYIALNGVVNYNLVGGLKIGIGVEPTFHFKDNILVENTIKSAFDIPIVVKAAYAFKYFDVALMYKHGTCNTIKGIPFMDGARSRDLQVSIFVPIFR